jgi:hypothetical protein
MAENSRMRASTSFASGLAVFGIASPIGAPVYGFRGCTAPPWSAKCAFGFSRSSSLSPFITACCCHSWLNVAGTRSAAFGPMNRNIASRICGMSASEEACAIMS